MMQDHSRDLSPDNHRTPTESKRASDFESQYLGIGTAVYAWASLHIRPALRPQLEPEDLVQEVTYRALAGYDRYDPEQGDFRGWVFGIARRVLHQALRRMNSSGPTPGRGRETVSAIADPATSISSRIVREENLSQFLERAAELSEDDQRLLLYRGLEGLSHEQVAEQLGTSSRAAAKRWERLRVRLQESLAMRELLSA